eukprot:gene12684-16893_t
MTTNGRGILPPDHPLGLSVSASFSATRQLIEASDVVLAIGTEFGPTDYDMYEDGFFSIPGKLIRIDIDPKHIMRTVMPEIGIVGDAASSALRLADAVSPAKRDGAARAATVLQNPNADLTGPMLGDLLILETIRDRLPGVIFVGDSTQLVYSGNLGYVAAEPGSYFNSATGYGTLGYAAPAAVGAAVADPSSPVVCLTGDGGFQFSLAEIGSAADICARVIYLVWNNDGYQEIETYMVENGITPEGVRPAAPDFCLVAKAYGVPAMRLGSLDDLPSALAQAATRNGPSLIEIHQTKT